MIAGLVRAVGAGGKDGIAEMTCPILVREGGGSLETKHLAP